MAIYIYISIYQKKIGLKTHPFVKIFCTLDRSLVKMKTLVWIALENYTRYRLCQ